MKSGFVRTPHVAGYWRGRLQLQVHRTGGWIAAWNGLRYGVIVGYDPTVGLELGATRGWRCADVCLIKRDGALALVTHIDPR